MKINFEKKSTDDLKKRMQSMQRFKNIYLQGKIRPTKKCDNFICNLQTNEP